MPANTNTDDDAVRTDADGPNSSLAWGTTAFEPGADVALVARQTVGLIERDNPSTRERLWALVSDDAPLDDILDELSSTGLKALPDFGLAQVEGTAIRVVARGRVEISAELASGSTHDIDASGVRTWIEELVEDVAAITITLPMHEDDAAAPSGDAFAVLAGSVPASSLSRRYDAPDDHAEAAESGAGWTAGGTDASTGARSEDLASSPDVELETVAEVDEPDAESSDSTFEEQAGETSAVVQPKADVENAPRSGTREAEAPAAAPAGPADIAAESEPPPPHTAAQPSDPQPASPQPPPPGSTPAGPPPAGPGAGGAPPAAPRLDATVIVGSDDGPTRGPVSSIFDDDFAEHAAGSASDAPLGDHDGQTAGDVAPSSSAPVWGVLAFSNGERVEVDRAILIGRNPKVAGAVEGALPHIMKFDGPGQGLSRTHAEVRVEGGQVLVEDLESTNGTEIQLPGQQRRRLRSREPVAIVPGTLIDFGDELHCTLEPAG